jgi:hypothetical protein
MVGTPTSRRAVYYFADSEESEYQGRQRITRQHVTVPETVPTVWHRLWESTLFLQKKKKSASVTTDQTMAEGSQGSFLQDFHESLTDLFRSILT